MGRYSVREQRGASSNRSVIAIATELVSGAVCLMTRVADIPFSDLFLPFDFDRHRPSGADRGAGRPDLVAYQ